MNKSSKITALLFVLILVFSLTACSGGSNDDYDSDHGEIEANTNLENAKYWYDEFGGVWYYDGIGITYLGDNYTIGEDSSELYDEYGNYIRGLW